MGSEEKENHKLKDTLCVRRMLTPVAPAANSLEDRMLSKEQRAPLSDRDKIPFIGFM